jgi:hypothetical protein
MSDVRDDRAPAAASAGGPDARRIRTSGRLLARLVIAAIALLAAPGAVQAAFTASIADLNLPAVTSSHVAQTTAGTMSLTVTDSAPGAGWNVTILASAFAYSGAHGGTSIPAVNLSITEARSPVLASGQAIDPSGGPKVPASGATGTLDVARKTTQAEIGYGGGTYTQELEVSLVVPADSRAGTYSSSLTVTVSAGP